MTEKQLLRKQVRERFPGDDARNAESAAICGHILASPEYSACDTLCAYAAMRREADVTAAMGQALADGKRLLLPRVEGDGIMTLRRITELSQLVPGSYSIPEPPTSAPEEALSEHTLLLVPLEAIDAAGMRLGKGGGFYDRLLADVPCAVMGVALSSQWTDLVPCDPWDQPLPMCADRDGIHRFD